MNCEKCRFRGTLCDGDTGQRGVPYPWNQFFKQDAEEFEGESWDVWPTVNVCQETPPRAIPQIDGRVNWLEDLDWVAIRLAQVFETKRRKGGWKTVKNLRYVLQLPDHVKMYLSGCGKDDQLWRIMQDPHWAERIAEYGIQYASPLNFSMYHNSTSCQVVWSLLMSWKAAKQLSDAGVKVIPNVEGPDKIEVVQRQWVEQLKAPTIMTNFQMVYNKVAFERELEEIKRFVARWPGKNIILNGVTHAQRVVQLSALYPFSFVSGVLFTNAQYRRKWNPQGGFTRQVVEASKKNVQDIFAEGFRSWKGLIHGYAQC